MLERVVDGSIPRTCCMLLHVLFDEMNEQDNAIAMDFIDFIFFCHFFHLSDEEVVRPYSAALRCILSVARFRPWAYFLFQADC